MITPALRRLATGVTLVWCALFTLTAAAQNLDAVKARMLQRVTAIDQLKEQGVVGETSRGFLAFVGAKQLQADLVDAENRDRETVYNAIAKQTGAAAADVGRRRARQIADNARPGDYLQTAAGKWKKK